jgi:hypothetical protein
MDPAPGSLAANTSWTRVANKVVHTHPHILRRIWPSPAHTHIYCPPPHTRSILLTTLWFLLGLVLFQFAFLGYTVWLGRSEARRLVVDVHDLFRPWRHQHRVHVALRQVAHVVVAVGAEGPPVPSSDDDDGGGGNGRTRRTGRRRRQPGRERVQIGHPRASIQMGGYCFVMVFALLGEGQVRELDDRSLGTVNTADDCCDDDDDNDDNDNNSNNYDR